MDSIFKESIKQTICSFDHPELQRWAAMIVHIVVAYFYVEGLFFDMLTEQMIDFFSGSHINSGIR